MKPSVFTVVASAFLAVIIQGLIIAAAADSGSFLIKDGILQNSLPIHGTLAYKYAPVIMFDYERQKYIIWFSGEDAGDTIYAKEANTFASLASAPAIPVYYPAKNPVGLNGHAADPSVIKVGNEYFLYVTAAHDPGAPVPFASGIAVASTTNPLNPNSYILRRGGTPIVQTVSDVYGFGQPSVVKVGNNYYLFFCSDFGGGNAHVTVLRANNPEFYNFTQIKVFPIADLGPSLDVVYDRQRQQFLATDNYGGIFGQFGIPPLTLHTNANVTAFSLIQIDLNLNITGTKVYAADVGYELTEGIGILRDQKGELLRFATESSSYLTFVAGSPATSQCPPPSGIPPDNCAKRGPLRYIHFVEHGVNGDLNNDGFGEIIIWNPRAFEYSYEVYMSKKQPGTEGVIGYPQKNIYYWGLRDLQHRPVIADYNGDGRDDLAVYQPGNGMWFVQNPSLSVQWGAPGDLPVPGDYDGDGDDDITVFRPSTGQWILKTPNYLVVQWGIPGVDVPIVNFKTSHAYSEIAVFRWTNGTVLCAPGGPC